MTLLSLIRRFPIETKIAKGGIDKCKIV